MTAIKPTKSHSPSATQSHKKVVSPTDELPDTKGSAGQAAGVAMSHSACRSHLPPSEMAEFGQDAEVQL